MGGRRVDGGRPVERVRALCRASEDERALRITLLDEIRREAPFDVFAWLLTDPETEVGSAPVANAPSLADLPRLIRARYLTATNRWTTMAEPVATLVDATGGDPERSLVWRDVWSGYGVTDVASVVFRDQHGCWGWLDLWRLGDGAPFSGQEREYLQAIAAPVTEALRGCQARTFDRPAASHARGGPVLLVLSPELEVKAQTPETDAYLRALVPPDGDRRPIPAGAYNVAAQLLAVEAGIDDHPPWARVHLGEGTWMTLRAARVDATDSVGERDIAVAIEPASPAERRTLYARAHALSPRETEIVEHLTRGADTKTLSRELFLSEHTVQDHLKSIFAKTGTRNRRTLLTRVAGG